MCTLRLLSLIAFHRVCSSPLPLLSQVDEWPINTLSHLPRNSSNCLSGCTFHHSIIYLSFLKILQMEAGIVAAQNCKGCWGCTRVKSDKSIFDFSIALWGAIGHHIKLLDRLKCRLKDWLKWSCSVKALHKTQRNNICTFKVNMSVPNSKFAGDVTNTSYLKDSLSFTS